MQELVALGVVFVMSTQGLVVASDWLLKQAGK
jgi:hypothetical protein